MGLLEPKYADYRIPGNPLSVLTGKEETLLDFTHENLKRVTLARYDRERHQLILSVPPESDANSRINFGRLWNPAGEPSSSAPLSSADDFIIIIRFLEVLTNRKFTLVRSTHPTVITYVREDRAAEFKVEWIH